MRKYCILEEKIKYICNNQFNFFLNKQNVVGLGFGYKVKGGFKIPQKCIAVFVRKKVKNIYLDSKNLIPKFYKGIITDVVEVGIIKDKSFTSRIRPVPGGYVIGNSENVYIGTLGCVVEDAKNEYILTCSHVLDKYYKPIPNMRIIQPSKSFGGKPNKDVIGMFIRSIPVEFISPKKKPTNYVDCAICKIDNLSDVSYKIALLGNIEGINISPNLNKAVKKVGYKTELTTGKIIYLHTTISVEVATGVSACFKDQISTNVIINEGDSGSMLLDNDMNAVGLCKSSSDTGMSYATPIGAVLNSLNVSIVIE